MAVQLDEFGMVVLSSGNSGGGGGGSSSSMNFYKCASVDTTNHKWSGYLASVDSITGVWSFAETATADLPYDRITPVVGNVYDENCTFEVRGYKTGLPETGRIFYLPLDQDPGATDVQGNTLYFQTISKIAYGQTVQGIPCTKFVDNSGISGPDFSSILANDSSTELTISEWVSSNNGFSCGFSYKRADADRAIVMTGFTGNTKDWRARAGGDSVTLSSLSGSGFVHLLATFGSNQVKAYVNGTLTGTGSYANTDRPFGWEAAWCPYVFGMYGGSTTTYVAGFRIYNRILDSSEIAALAAEFTPTVS